MKNSTQKIIKNNKKLIFVQELTSIFKDKKLYLKSYNLIFKLNFKNKISKKVVKKQMQHIMRSMFNLIIPNLF
jgi:hypothetical protein